jgi:flagellar motor switch protein FliG
MNSNLSPLRKAAILLHSLDEATAAGLLRRMSSEETERVGRELAALGEIDPEICQRVVAEFRGLENSPRAFDSSGIELEESLAKKISSGTTAFDANSTTTAETPPFRFLCEAEVDTLVQFLWHERPQVIALVMSHLAPDRAARLLERLDAKVQGQVLERLSHLDETDPAVLHDLEDHLRSQLNDHIRLRKCQAAGAAAVSAILATVDPRKRSALLQTLAERDRALADRLRPNAQKVGSGSSVQSQKSMDAADNFSIGECAFDRLYHLTNEELRRLISRVPSEIVIVALAGADAPLVERVLKCVPPKQSRLFSRALKHLGPTRLGDVEEAQLMLGRLAMEIDGRATNRTQSRGRRALTAQ